MILIATVRDNSWSLFGHVLAFTQFVFSVPIMMTVMGTIVLYGSAMLQSFVDNQYCKLNGGGNSALHEPHKNEYKNGLVGLFAAMLFIFAAYFQKAENLNPLFAKNMHIKSKEVIWFVTIFVATLPIFMIGWAAVVTTCAPVPKDWNSTVLRSSINTASGTGIVGLDCLNTDPSTCENSSMEPVSVLFVLFMAFMAMFSFDKVWKDNQYSGGYIGSNGNSPGAYHNLGGFYAVLDVIFRFLAFVFITAILSEDEDDNYKYRYDYNIHFSTGDYRESCSTELIGLSENARAKVTPLHNDNMHKLAISALAFAVLEMSIKVWMFYESNWNSNWLTEKFQSKSYYADIFYLTCAFSRVCVAVFMHGFIIQNALWVCPAYQPKGLYHAAMFLLFMVPTTSMLQLLRINHESVNNSQ